MSRRIKSRDKSSGQHISTTQNPPAPRNEVTQFLADINGVPVLVRFLVGDLSGDMQSRFISGAADLHSLLSSTVEKMVDRIGGTYPQCPGGKMPDINGNCAPRPANVPPQRQDSALLYRYGHRNFPRRRCRVH